ncbi:glycosyltransferase [Bacillus sp. FSL W8-1127]|jgi:colanic acid/amylovoran biosynthesis glycosyltransferase|uniref:glycosyltransferase n=1 Tax=Bacillus sp. FSL W8-1127 TaxID=2954710 RepID=UPI0030F567FD
MKKILFIVGEFPKLSETFILNQITGLIDYGHDVTILAQKPKHIGTVHEDVVKYGLMEKTIYYEYSDKKGERIARFLKLLPSNPWKVIQSVNVMKYGKEVLSMRPLFAYHSLRRLSGDYDIIHCHFGPNGILGAVLRDLGVIKGKVFTTFHGYDMTAYIDHRGKEAYRYLFEKGDGFLPISVFWKNRLISLGCDERKIIVHPMGIDIERFRFIQASSDDPVIKILSIARLVEKKGLIYAIESVSRLINEGVQIEYNIIGNGPLENQLKERISQLGMESHIKLLGPKTQQETIRHLQESHMFLLPSVTSSDGDMEGIPVVLMEAMAMGKPVISTYHSGIPELITDGKDGLLVPERDSETLYQKLKSMIQDKSQWELMGKQARLTVSKKHDIHQLNRKLESIFQS